MVIIPELVLLKFINLLPIILSTLYSFNLLEKALPLRLLFLNTILVRVSLPCNIPASDIALFSTINVSFPP